MRHRVLRDEPHLGARPPVADIDAKEGRSPVRGVNEVEEDLDSQSIFLRHSAR